MPKFLNGVSFISSAGTEVEITKAPTEYKEASSSIDGNSTYNTLIIRDDNNRFQVSVSDDDDDNAVINKLYIDPKTNEWEEGIEDLERPIVDIVHKNAETPQTISGKVLYNGSTISALSLINKGYVDGCRATPFTVESSVGFSFPHNKDGVYALLTDWGDGSYNVCHFSPHHYNSGIFNGCFYFSTEIKHSAFYNCVELTNITIPNSITSINEWAFSGCNGLTSIIIPNSVKNIKYSAFLSCRELTSVTIGNSVESIGRYAFDNCAKLSSVTIYNETPPALGLNVFSETLPGLVIYVPANAVEAYKAAIGWEDLNIQAIQGGE